MAVLICVQKARAHINDDATEIVGGAGRKHVRGDGGAAGRLAEKRYAARIAAERS